MERGGNLEETRKPRERGENVEEREEAINIAGK